MPFCSTLASAVSLISSSLTSLPASSSTSSFMASAMRILRWRVLPGIPCIMPCSWLVSSSMPAGPMMPMFGIGCATSISISLSSSSPSRKRLRNFWRATESSAVEMGFSKSQ